MSRLRGVKAAAGKGYVGMEAQEAYKWLASVDGYTAAWRCAGVSE